MMIKALPSGFRVEDTDLCVHECAAGTKFNLY